MVYCDQTKPERRALLTDLSACLITDISARIRRRKARTFASVRNRGPTRRKISTVWPVGDVVVMQPFAAAAQLSGIGLMKANPDALLGALPLPLQVLKYGELWRYATLCRVANVMRPYMERLSCALCCDGGSQ